MSRQLNGKSGYIFDNYRTRKSAKIFKHLNEEEIEELTLQIANMKTVSSEKENS